VVVETNVIVLPFKVVHMQLFQTHQHKPNGPMTTMFVMLDFNADFD
jgi:hypothetical protein